MPENQALGWGGQAARGPPQPAPLSPCLVPGNSPGARPSPGHGGARGGLRIPSARQHPAQGTTGVVVAPPTAPPAASVSPPARGRRLVCSLPRPTVAGRAEFSPAHLWRQVGDAAGASPTGLVPPPPPPF